MNIGRIETVPKSGPQVIFDADTSTQVKPALEQPGMVMKAACEIKTQPLSWLWPGRLPAGKLSLMIGDPGLGKSLVSVDIAARITIGRDFPDGKPCTAGQVIMLSAEDDSADTIVPRLKAAGADLRHVHLVEAVRVRLQDGGLCESIFNLGRDVEQLEKAVSKLANVRAVIIDPLSAYLGAADSRKNAEVRGLLAPVASLSARYGAAIMCISHLRKSAGAPVHRAIDSIAFAAAARSVWAVAGDPNNSVRRLMVPVKQNLAPDIGGLSFEVAATSGVPVVVWDGSPVAVDIQEVLGGLDSDSERSVRAEAQDWLRNSLREGPVRASDVQSECRAAGLSWATVRRAKSSLGVVAAKVGFGTKESRWEWRLPNSGEGEQCEDAQPHISNVSAFEHLPESKMDSPTTNSEDAQLSTLEGLGIFEGEDDGEVEL